MLTLYILAFALMLGMAAFAALGVEDTKHHEAYTPTRYETMSPAFLRWEDSLPGRPVLPWNTSTAEWIESEGK